MSAANLKLTLNSEGKLKLHVVHLVGSIVIVSLPPVPAVIVTIYPEVVLSKMTSILTPRLSIKRTSVTYVWEQVVPSVVSFVGWISKALLTSCRRTKSVKAMELLPAATNQSEAAGLFKLQKGLWVIEKLCVHVKIEPTKPVMAEYCGVCAGGVEELYWTELIWSVLKRYALILSYWPLNRSYNVFLNVCFTLNWVPS